MKAFLSLTISTETTNSTRQVVKVDQKSRMEAELASLDSQLQRAKLAQAVRAQRIQSDLQPTVADGTPEESKDSLSAKRILFPEETHATETSSRKSSDQDEVRPQWTPQLDLSTPQLDLLTGGHQVCVCIYPRSQYSVKEYKHFVTKTCIYRLNSTLHPVLYKLTQGSRHDLGQFFCQRKGCNEITEHAFSSKGV